MAKKVPGLYRRPGSPYWWAKWSVNGVPQRQSTGTEKITEAEAFLNARKGAKAEGRAVNIRLEKVSYAELAGDLRVYYAAYGGRDPVEAETRLKHLDHFFAFTRAAAITESLITRYVQQRQGEEAAAAGTVNRELAVLGRMLRLAYRAHKLLRVPVIEKLKEAPPRAGFFEPEQYESVRRHLPEDLQVAAAVAYVLGWRTQSEVLTRERRHLNLEAGTLSLDPGESKNGEPRECYLTPELKSLLATQLARVEALQRQTGSIVRFLFPHFTSGRRHTPGARRKDYRKVWATACTKAGIPGMLRHDMRRSAVRNMVNAGVPEKVAMDVTGHTTRSVFDRYHIVSQGDRQNVAKLMTGTIRAHSAL